MVACKPMLVWAGLLAVCLAAPGACLGDERREIERRIHEVAAGLKAVKPAKPRKVLVFTRTRGYRHESIPLGVLAVTRAGRLSGAFDAHATDDPGSLEPEVLARFDAICFLNTTGNVFELEGDASDFDHQVASLQVEARLRLHLLEFVRSGKGFVGIHSAADTLAEWPEYGAMLGARFDGHPWNERVGVKVEEPSHPLTAMLPALNFEIEDEIYQFAEPYSRDQLRVLLSLDPARTPMQRPGVNRTDGDFALSWIRREGEGRVFYCALGHRDTVYADERVMAHVLAGFQWALGDLTADDAPSTGLPAAQAGGGK